MKWIVLFSLILFSVACSNDSAELVLNNASLNVNIDAVEIGSGGGLKSTRYKREGAPVYIKGVEMTAKNTEYNVADVKQTFLFASDNPNDGEDIVMEGLSVGTNVITAKGLPRYEGKTKYYWNIPVNGTNDIDRAAPDCYNYLIKKHPIYAEYYSESPVEKVIKSNGDNQINVNMVSENHRVAIVFDNKSDKYNVVMFVREGNRTLAAVSIRTGGNLALVVNDRNAKGSKTYNIDVTYYTKTTFKRMGSFSKEIKAGKYDNIAKLYRFSKDELYEGNVRTTIKWNTKDFVIGGETIE